jgi:hypothetical protein
MTQEQSKASSTIRRPRTRPTDEDKESQASKLTAAQRIKQGKETGLQNSTRKQNLARRPKASGEKVIRGIKNNAFIVLGNDRPGSRTTGYGALPDHPVDMIDIVAGLGGNEVQSYSRQNQDAAQPGQAGRPKKRSVRKKVYTEPDFKWDAARIYISQKTDIDHNFQLVEGAVGMAVEKSAIGIKADGVRILARDGVKIISDCDSYNSQGGKKMVANGIDLIAGNVNEYPNDLQPLVKGRNLSLAIEELWKNTAALAKILHGYMKNQMEYNNYIANHTHHSPFFGVPTLPSNVLMKVGVIKSMKDVMNTEADILKSLTNYAGYQAHYLEPSGPQYILSQNNKTN